MAKQKEVKEKPKKKPARSVRRAPQRKPSGGGLRLFYRETIGELRKVSWPTRREAINLTKIVVLVMVAMAVVLGTLDILFYRFFAFLLNT